MGDPHKSIGGIELWLDSELAKQQIARFSVLKTRPSRPQPIDLIEKLFI
jgi:hypothetical protein